MPARKCSILGNWSHALSFYRVQRSLARLNFGVGGHFIGYFDGGKASLDRVRFQVAGEHQAVIDVTDAQAQALAVRFDADDARLDGLATLLTQLFVRLHVQYRFDRAAVVAHSMGGLVTREFLLQDYEISGSEVVRTYVTISSPLGGMVSAGQGVETSPIVVRSWYGLAPGSPFLDGLFYKDPAAKTQRRRLPAHMAYHMLFGFLGGGLSGSSDGIVALSSQLRPEAQEEARSERGFDENHTSILRSPAVANRLNEILAAMR